MNSKVRHIYISTKQATHASTKQAFWTFHPDKIGRYGRGPAELLLPKRTSPTRILDQFQFGVEGSKVQSFGVGSLWTHVFPLFAPYSYDNSKIFPMISPSPRILVCLSPYMAFSRAPHVCWRLRDTYRYMPSSAQTCHHHAAIFIPGQALFVSTSERIRTASFRRDDDYTFHSIKSYNLTQTHTY